MKLLDPTTLFVVGGLVLFVGGISFLLETILRRNDAVGRLWSVFYLSAMLAVFAFVIASLDAGTWWAKPTGSGAAVIAAGLLWSGARRANGRGALLPVPIALGLLVIVAALLLGTNGGRWAGVEFFTGVGITCLLSAFEFSRGVLARLLAARVLTVLVGGAGLYYVARAVALVVLGPDAPTFESLFGTSVATLVGIGCTVIGTIMLSSVQGDRFAQLDEDDAEIGTRLRIDGVLNAQQFREVGETWLLRGLRERATLVLLLVDVADLGAVNTAFGRAAGDAAIRATGRTVITQAPTSSLVGHLTTRRFALLFELSAFESVSAVADRIGETLLGAMIDDRDRFRASTFRGVATTHTSGARFGDLLAAAEQAIAVEAAAAHARESDSAPPRS